MTAAEFITKWGEAEVKERSDAREHFSDLCRLSGGLGRRGIHGASSRLNHDRVGE